MYSEIESTPCLTERRLLEMRRRNSREKLSDLMMVYFVKVSLGGVSVGILTSESCLP
jgi:hypothetical protein